MRVALQSLPLLAALLLPLHALLAQGTPEDQAAILRVIHGHADAWNHRDAGAASEAYAIDAVIHTSGGQILRGRQAIEDAHREWLAGDSATGGSTHSHPPSTINIRFLRPDVAVADVEGRFDGGLAADGNPLPPRRLLLFIVLTKERGEWHVLEQRVTGRLTS